MILAGVIVELLLAATATALATGLGALPVFMLGERARVLQPALWGLAGGVMTVASVLGLLVPALDEGSWQAVTGGLVAGVGFLLATRRALGGRDLHVGRLRGESLRTPILVFAVLLVHSLPEGLAIGSAYASETAGLGLFIVIAIGLQNIPEGTSVAIPMAEAGFGRAAQFWAAVATSAPQPVGAVVAFVAVEEVAGLLPLSFAFAAGAMLSLVVVEVVPRISGPAARPAGATGFAAGAAVMVLAGLLLSP
jgi:ZIP family zinc transporter